MSLPVPAVFCAELKYNHHHKTFHKEQNIQHLTLDLNSIMISPTYGTVNSFHQSVLRNAVALLAS